MGTVHSLSVSDRKGIRKHNISSAVFEEDFGIQGDAHGGKWHRQVSFLAQESIDKMTAKGLDVKSGDFAENVTTQGLDLLSLPVGTKLTVGDAEFVISQIGKVCHNRCAIYHQAGDCVMPREGIFGIVIRGGAAKPGDAVDVKGKNGASVGIIALETADELKKSIEKELEPSFVRCDVVPEKSVLPSILDFTQNQKFDLVLVLADRPDDQTDFPEHIIFLPEKSVDVALLKTRLQNSIV